LFAVIEPLFVPGIHYVQSRARLTIGQVKYDDPVLYDSKSQCRLKSGVYAATFALAKAIRR
jgi:hypothetical protein